MDSLLYFKKVIFVSSNLTSIRDESNQKEETWLSLFWKDSDGITFKISFQQSSFFESLIEKE